MTTLRYDRCPARSPIIPDSPATPEEERKERVIAWSPAGRLCRPDPVTILSKRGFRRWLCLRHIPPLSGPRTRGRRTVGRAPAPMTTPHKSTLTRSRPSPHRAPFGHLEVLGVVDHDDQEPLAPHAGGVAGGESGARRLSAAPSVHDPHTVRCAYRPSGTPRCSWLLHVGRDNATELLGRHVVALAAGEAALITAFIEARAGKRPGVSHHSLSNASRHLPGVMSA